MRISGFSAFGFSVGFFAVSIVFGVSGDTISSDFEPGGKPETKLINPDAEVIIGSVLNIRERGSGLFGCGKRRLEGIASAEALKWMVDELNGKIWSGESANVSFGLRIMDGCGRTGIATSQLIDFLPELIEKPSPKRPFKLCLIDGVGLKRDEDVGKSLEDVKFPVIETDFTIDSASDLSNAVFLFVRELQWDRFAIIHAESKFSSAMLSNFLKSVSRTADFCVPWIVNLDDRNESEKLRFVFESGIPVLSLLSTEDHPSLLDVLRDVSLPKKKKITVFFSDLVTRKQLTSLPGHPFRILSTIPFPETEISFEKYLANDSPKVDGNEDELDAVERGKMAKKIKRIGRKISETLKNAVERICHGKESLCPNLLSFDGKNFIRQSLAKSEWTDSDRSYQLVEYKFRLSDENVHLHKIMAYSGHEKLKIFDIDISFSDFDCDGERKYASECRCLELKLDRTEFSRNLDGSGRKRQRNWRNDFAIGSGDDSSHPTSDGVAPFSRQPMAYSTLNDPLNGTLACLTLLGGLATLTLGQYFATFAALPNGVSTTGTSVIGYVILVGLFLLFSSNLTFLLTPMTATCVIRRLAPNVSYAIIFSGMLIKVWTSLRCIASDEPKIVKPFALLACSFGFTCFQGFLSGLWLFLKPPATEFKGNNWICYPPDGLDSHLLLLMIYPLLLLLGTIVLAIRTCSKSNNDEARWILISSFLVSIVLCCWGIAIGTGVWQFHRTVSTNLAAGTILLLCLYAPKIKMHSKLKKTMKMQAKISSSPAEIDKECSVFTASPAFPVVFGYNMVAAAPVSNHIPEDIIDPNYVNQAFSVDESSETASTPFDVDASSNSELEQEPHTFSTFFEPPAIKPEKEDAFNDPTQMVPSTLYPLDMFSIEPIAIASDHCQPGTNEFTPPHRTTSQLYICHETEWVP